MADPIGGQSLVTAALSQIRADATQGALPDKINLTVAGQTFELNFPKTAEDDKDIAGQIAKAMGDKTTADVFVSGPKADYQFTLNTVSAGDKKEATITERGTSGIGISTDDKEEIQKTLKAKTEDKTFALPGSQLSNDEINANQAKQSQAIETIGKDPAAATPSEKLAAMGIFVRPTAPEGMDPNRFNTIKAAITEGKMPSPGLSVAEFKACIVGSDGAAWGDAAIEAAFRQNSAGNITIDDAHIKNAFPVVARWEVLVNSEEGKKAGLKNYSQCTGFISNSGNDTKTREFIDAVKKNQPNLGSDESVANYLVDRYLSDPSAAGYRKLVDMDTSPASKIRAVLEYMSVKPPERAKTSSSPIATLNKEEVVKDTENGGGGGAIPAKNIESVMAFIKIDAKSITTQVESYDTTGARGFTAKVMGENEGSPYLKFGYGDKANGMISMDEINKHEGGQAAFKTLFNNLAPQDQIAMVRHLDTKPKDVATELGISTIKYRGLNISVSELREMNTRMLEYAQKETWGSNSHLSQKEFIAMSKNLSSREIQLIYVLSDVRRGERADLFPVTLEAGITAQAEVALLEIGLTKGEAVVLYPNVQLKDRVQIAMYLKELHKTNPKLVENIMANLKKENKTETLVFLANVFSVL